MIHKLDEIICHAFHQKCLYGDAIKKKTDAVLNKMRNPTILCPDGMYTVGETPFQFVIDDDSVRVVTKKENKEATTTKWQKSLRYSLVQGDNSVGRKLMTGFNSKIWIFVLSQDAKKDTKKNSSKYISQCTIKAILISFSAFLCMDTTQNGHGIAKMNLLKHCWANLNNGLDSSTDVEMSPTDLKIEIISILGQDYNPSSTPSNPTQVPSRPTDQLTIQPK